MGKTKKSIVYSLLSVLIIVVLLFIYVIVNYNIKLKAEQSSINPIGEFVTVNGHKIHLLSEGKGDVNLVFMAGYGTLVPSYDFSPLYDTV